MKQIHIFRDLAEADAKDLRRVTTFKRLKHGDPISAEAVYLLKEGRVKIYETSGEGESVALEVLEPGEIFGAVAWDIDAADRNVAAEALTEVVLGVIAVKHFLFFLKRKTHLEIPLERPLYSRPLGRCIQAILDTVGRVLRVPKLPSFETSDVVNSVTRRTWSSRGVVNPLAFVMFRSPASRLALLLRTYVDATRRSPGAIGLRGQHSLRKFSTNRLAQLIGSSVEKTELLLKQFEYHKILERRYRRIRVLDPWRLKKIADARLEALPPVPVSDQERNEIYERNESLSAVGPTNGR